MNHKLLLYVLFLSFALLFFSCKSTSNEKLKSGSAALVLSKPATDTPETVRSESEEALQESTVGIDEPVMDKVTLPAHEQPSIPQKSDEAEVATPRHLDADNYYNIGVSLYNTGHYEDAAGAFKKTLDINPDYIRAHYDLALAYIKLDDLAAALDEYRKLLVLDQDMADDLRKAAVIAVSSGSDYKLIIQVGAFRMLKNAEKLINNLKADYLFVYMEKPGNLHKVRIHGVRTMEEGKRIMQDIKKKFNILPFMIIRE